MVWEVLGLKKTIEDVVLVDRPGAAIIGFLWCDPSCQNTYMEPVQFSEIMAMTYWYLWWQRRCMVKNEDVLTALRRGQQFKHLR